jgi:hypothetical protein
MHSAVLLVEENKQLWAKNVRQKKKKAKRRSYIAMGGVLTVYEGLDQAQSVNIELVSSATRSQSVPQLRAPRACSLCRSLVHTARTCPLREGSN